MMDHLHAISHDASRDRGVSRARLRAELPPAERRTRCRRRIPTARQLRLATSSPCANLDRVSVSVMAHNRRNFMTLLGCVGVSAGGQ